MLFEKFDEVFEIAMNNSAWAFTVWDKDAGVAEPHRKTMNSMKNVVFRCPK